MPFLRNAPGLEAVYRDYAPKGVQFYIVYKSVVHPGTNGFVDAFTLKERLQQLAIAKTRLGTTVPMICDGLDDAIVTALQAAPNSEFVVDAEGKVVHRKFWHDPKALRAFLADRVGPVAKPTEVADLGMKLTFPAAGAPRGKVPPLATPDNLTILETIPQLAETDTAEDAQPFFAKLLAEGDAALLRTGTGQVYLGFFIDPIYPVHWNNRAAPLRVTIDDPGDPDFIPIEVASPTYDHDADVDPREFLLRLDGKQKGRELRLTVRYAACDDGDTFCVPVEQRYRLKLVRKPGGASRAGQWMTDLVGDPLQWDDNRDGKVTRSELPRDRAQIILLHFDRNHDEVIDGAEAALFHDMIRVPARK